MPMYSFAFDDGIGDGLPWACELESNDAARIKALHLFSDALRDSPMAAYDGAARELSVSDETGAFNFTLRFTATVTEAEIGLDAVA